MNHTQKVLASVPGGVVECELPSPGDEVLEGVPWGRFDELFTPAFWAGRVWLSTLDGRRRTHRLGLTLREEAAACLLGGFGIPAEVGLAAFQRLRERHLLTGTSSVELLTETLREPLDVRGKLSRYRFARTKAAYLSEVLRRIDFVALDVCDTDFRNSLAELPGIGLKTASWITRNMRESDEVAILDVHLCRACVLAGVFHSDFRLGSGYLDLEKRYLTFTRAIGVRPSLLDALMWETMRRIPRGTIRPIIQTRQPVVGSAAPCQDQAAETTFPKALP